MVMLFAEKMAGGADDDDTILKAFDAFEVNGKIDADMFKHSLMTFGDEFTSKKNSSHRNKSNLKRITLKMNRSKSSCSMHSNLLESGAPSLKNLKLLVKK